MTDEPIALFIDVYLDADVQRSLAELLRREGFDVVSARELGHDDWDDGKQLAFAVANGRAILTHNTRHFIPLAKAYAEAGRLHYGIIVSEQLPLGELAQRMLRLLDSVTRDEMMNAVWFLSSFAD
jgi:hypothetical protein